MRQAVGAAEPAAADRHGLLGRLRGAAGQRQRDIELGPRRQGARPDAGLRWCRRGSGCGESCRLLNLSRRTCPRHTLADHRRHRRGRCGSGRGRQQCDPTAEIVFGGKRHLALAAGLITGEARAWPSPFDRACDAVAGLRGRSVCVLASGDPFLHGVGATLARHVEPAEMNVLPAPSAFCLAAARLGWPLQTDRDRLAAWQDPRPDPAAAASGRAHSGADLGCATGRQRWRGCCRARLRWIAADSARGARRAGRTDQDASCRGLLACQHQSAQRRGDRGRSRA